MKKLVKIENTAGGFLPTMYWGEGEHMDREAYWISFNNFAAAEVNAMAWADREGADYVPYVEIDAKALQAEARLVRQYREEGMDLHNAIRRAKGCPYAIEQKR